jgi:transcription termination factor 2
MRWARHVARIREGRGVHRILIGRPEGKRPLGRPRRKWKDNIKMDLRETGIDGANWIQLAPDRVQWRACVNTVMSLRVP